MTPIRILPILLALAACASEPRTAPQIAALMPETVLDLRRQGTGDGDPDFIVRYASGSGNGAALYLSPDPALAGTADGIREEALRPHLTRGNRTLGTELLRRGDVPGLARVVVRDERLMAGRDGAVCLLAPVADPPSLEALCFTVLSGQVARARISVAGIRGTGRDRTVYAGHAAAHLFGHLRRATPYRPASRTAAAAPADDGPIFPERGLSFDGGASLPPGPATP